MKFQTFWSGLLSPYETLCLGSFVRAGHEVDLYTYDPAMECSGVNVLDAAEILNQRHYSTEATGFVGHPGPFTDHFRYKLLYERGGWWVDADGILLDAPAQPDRAYFAWQDAGHINNAILFFQAGDVVMGDCLSRVKKLRRRGDFIWGDTGPYLLTDVLASQGLLETAAPRHACYPLDATEISDILVPEQCSAVVERIRGANFLHLWNAQLVHIGLDKFAPAPIGSWLRERFDAS